MTRLPGTLALILAFCQLPLKGAALNTLTADERAAGWQLLFDGKSLTGWRNYRKKEPGPEWQVADGAIVLQRKSEPGEPGKLLDGLMTEQEFGDFELSIEWRIAAGANSGIIYHVSESYPAPHDSGIEMQVLDNQRHPDAQKGLERQAGACYALYAPAKDVTHPVGEWNAARIVIRNNHVEHWLNGEKLLAFELGSDDWRQRVQKSKFKDVKGFGKYSKGHILLQDHSHHVEFRNIKIRTLS